MAALAAVDVAQVPPHLAVAAELVDLAHLVVVVAQLVDLALLAHKSQLPCLLHLVVEARLLVLADLVVEVQLLLSRQSFSAAMARSTP